MRFAGTPAEQVDGLCRAPVWPGMEAVAPMLPTTMPPSWASPGRCRPSWPRVLVPALVMAGDVGLPFVPDAARVMGQAIPQGQLRTLEGQTHEVNPGVLAPVLVEFF